MPLDNATTNMDATNEKEPSNSVQCKVKRNVKKLKGIYNKCCDVFFFILNPAFFHRNWSFIERSHINVLLKSY